MSLCCNKGDEPMRVRDTSVEQGMSPRSLDTHWKPHPSLRITTS